MEITFNNAKLLFYTDLRADELVQGLKAERPIRDLTERIITYMDHANQANYTFQRKKKERLAQNIKKLQEQRQKPIALDFADVQAIAYLVGTYQDSRSWLQRKFTSANPLDARVQEYAWHYERFKQTGNIEHGYFDKKTIDHMFVAADSEIQMDLRSKYLNKMFEKCCDYMNRKGNLLRLAEARDTILKHYHDERLDQLKRGFEDNDWSWRTANWQEERLSRTETKELAGYFQRQAKINGILFKTLYLTCLKLQGNPNPEQATEKLCKGFMYAYKRDGFINASCGPSDKV